MKNKYYYVWSKQETTDALNCLGFVHFYTREQADSFDSGKPFYFCIETKTYGLADVVPYKELCAIENNEAMLHDMVKNKTKKD